MSVMSVRNVGCSSVVQVELWRSPDEQNALTEIVKTLEQNNWGWDRISGRFRQLVAENKIQQVVSELKAEAPEKTYSEDTSSIRSVGNGVDSAVRVKSWRSLEEKSALTEIVKALAQNNWGWDRISSRFRRLVAENKIQQVVSELKVEAPEEIYSEYTSSIASEAEDLETEASDSEEVNSEGSTPSIDSEDEDLETEASDSEEVNSEGFTSSIASEDEDLETEASEGESSVAPVFSTLGTSASRDKNYGAVHNNEKKGSAAPTIVNAAERHYRDWGDTEKSQLLKELETGTRSNQTIHEIAKNFAERSKRTVEAVRHMANTLANKHRLQGRICRRRWTKQEDDKVLRSLLEGREKDMVLEEVEKKIQLLIPSRTQCAIRSRVRQIKEENALNFRSKNGLKQRSETLSSQDDPKPKAAIKSFNKCLLPWSQDDKDNLLEMLRQNHQTRFLVDIVKDFCEKYPGRKSDAVRVQVIKIAEENNIKLLLHRPHWRSDELDKINQIIKKPEEHKKLRKATEKEVRAIFPDRSRRAVLLKLQELQKKIFHK